MQKIMSVLGSFTSDAEIKVGFAMQMMERLLLLQYHQFIYSSEKAMHVHPLNELISGMFSILTKILIGD